VISPHDLYTEVDEKVAEWLEHGTRLVFVVNPRRRTVAVHRPGQPVSVLCADDVIDGEDVVPGWTLSVRELFGQS
jgi:Uma2 family endonuclease